MRAAITPPTPDPPLLRLDPGNPQELLGLIPYLLGFRPEESFVLLLFAERRLVLSARLDLGPPDHAASLAGYCRGLAEAHRATGALVVVFSEHFDPAVALLDRWSAAWARSWSGRGGRRRRRRDPCPLFDAVYADGRRWWSRGIGPHRSRTEGMPYDPRASNAAATAVLAGLPALASRAELQARVAGPPARDRPSLAALAARAVRDLDAYDRPARLSLMTATVAELLAGDIGPDADPRRRPGEGLTDERCARLALLAADIAVRDVAWSMITTERAGDHTELWCRVARRTIDRYALGPLALAGFAAWVDGQGALMNCCIERAEAIDPDYSLIALLAEIGRRGIPPSAWRELGPALREEARRTG